MRKLSRSPGKNKQAVIPARKAAMYVRVAAEQPNATVNQANIIREYAARHNIEIVKTYMDSGKSGLKPEGLDALKKLMDDVQAGNALFSMILLLDVARWGRFQDADEASYYENMCRRAGIDVQYVELSESNDSTVSALIKSTKHAMTGKYIFTLHY